MEIDKSKILIGTSGFSYEDWIGPVYPAGTTKEEMLSYYSGELGFNIVELNFTYYKQPSAIGMDRMLKTVPEGFTFAVKAHESMTHKIRSADSSFIRDEGAFGTFLNGVAPLAESGRLKCVLAQFPMKFQRNRDTVDHLKWFADRLKTIRLVVEFRNKSWVSQSTFDLLKGLGVGCCVVDEPDLPDLVPFTPVFTANPAYFRFHGRNLRWFNDSAAQRYNYLYSESELRSTLESITRISAVADETLIFFNNHFQGSAVKNAKMLKGLVGLP
jgi:uncharacterized protein YecE (DUF72 family)